MRIVVLSDAGFAAIFDRMPGTSTSTDPTVQEQNDAPHVARALRSLGHDVSEITIATSAAAALDVVVKNRPDLVVNLCDSVQGKPALAPLVPAFLDAHDVKHTGGDAGSLALCKRKHDVKAILAAHALPTPKYQVLLVDDDVDGFRLQLEPPVILKLCGEHASVGIDPTSVCFTDAEVKKKAKQLQAQHQQHVLVEEFVGGREFYVSCLGRPLRHLPLMETKLEGLPLRTFQKKWTEEETQKLDPRLLLPVPLRRPVVDVDVDVEAAGEIAARALHVVGWRDWGRVDLRLDQNGVPLIIDVTPMTYAHPDAPCLKAAEAAGVDYASFWRFVVEDAVS